MGLSNEQIEHGSIRRYFTKIKAGVHKYMKRSTSKLRRIESKKINVDGDNLNPKRHYSGWEY